MKKRNGSNLITQKQYAEHLGISVQAVNRMVRSGKIPSLHGRINPKVADAALLPKRGENRSFAEAQRRKEWALAQLRELDLQVASGKVAKISDVQRSGEIMCGNIRSKLLQLPGKLAQRLTGREGQAEIKAILDAEIFDALTELAAHAADGIGE